MAPPSISRPYATEASGLTAVDSVVMCGNGIVVLPALRDAVLSGLHVTQQGVPAIKAMAQDLVWWPRIKRDISRMRLEYITRHRMTKSNPARPLTKPILPEYPFQFICSNFSHSHGRG